MTDALVHSLEPRYYTDPDIFDREVSELLSRTWQFAGHANEIPNPGDYFTFQVAGENLFCIRGQDNIIRTFYNVCQHRAHELVSDRGHARVVVCPYHAWSYELTGQLRTGPNLNSVPGFDRSKICLTGVLTEDYLGFIFVNLDSTAAPMEEWYPGVKNELLRYFPQIDQIQPHRWIKIEEKCNWKVSVENYCECYHCAKNHPTFANGVVKTDSYDIQPLGEGYVLRQITEGQNLDAMTYPIDLGSNPHAGEYRSWFLWPTFSFQCYPGNILNTYHWRVDNHQTCDVWRGWFTYGDAGRDIVEQLAIQDRETTVEEDIGLVESVQRGLASRGYVPGPLVIDPAGGINSEHSMAMLHRWFKQSIDVY